MVNHPTSSKLFYLAVGKNIRQYRDLRNYSLQTLGEKVGLTKKTIQRYENGEIKIDMNRLAKISEALDVEMSKLLEGTQPFLGISLSDLETVSLPVVKSLTWKSGEVQFTEIEDYEPTPASWLTNGEYFYLRSQDNFLPGNSVHPGDLLLINKQPEAEEGNLAVLLLQGEIQLRKIFRRDPWLILQSEDLETPPLLLAKEECLILGSIKKIIRTV